MNENRLILILGLAGFVVMADNWVVSPILPAIAKSLQVSPVRAGLLISAYMIPFGLFQLVFGPLADRYGKRPVITFSMVFFTVGTALCGLGLGLFDLALYRAVTGVFAASVMPISLALIADVVPMERRQQAIGTFMGISFLGQGLSMAVGGSIAYFVSWRGVFFTYAALSVISTLLLIFVGGKAPSKKNRESRFLKPYVDLLRNVRSLWVYIVVLLEGILIIGSFSYLGAYTEHLFSYNYFDYRPDPDRLRGRGGDYRSLGGENRATNRPAEYLESWSRLDRNRQRPSLLGHYPTRAIDNCHSPIGYRIHAGPFQPYHHRDGIRQDGPGYRHVLGGFRLHGWRRRGHGYRGQDNLLRGICLLLWFVWTFPTDFSWNGQSSGPRGQEVKIRGWTSWPNRNMFYEGLVCFRKPQEKQQHRLPVERNSIRNRRKIPQNRRLSR